MATVPIIDDECIVRLTLRDCLESQGHRVLEASDGAEGLQVFDNEPVDVVVTDIVMPEKEGVETILELKRRSADIGIIAISGGGRIDATDFLRIAHRLGADHTLQKPFALPDLHAALNDCLERAVRPR
jgi:YesN/AraC family two-component response regulator